ncbi:MAG: hypothetical protein KGL12_13465, partial [Rhodospirillales bacterium]|nr:hypothetical protein [Rhodospirillales bacterium]
ASWPAVLHGLGFRIRPAMALPANMAGPPAPPLLLARRRPPQATPPLGSGDEGGRDASGRGASGRGEGAGAPPGGPFAVLAGLRLHAAASPPRPPNAAPGRGKRGPHRHAANLAKTPP